MKYAIIRTESAGVYAGYIESRNGQELVIRNARKLWFWDGAATLSELAMKGVSKPKECKFPCEVDKVEVLGATEILYCTKVAQDNIKAVPVWSVNK